MDFFRFPRTPHLLWLGRSVPRDDKVLSPSEVSDLLGGEVVVEEKVDGANVGLSLASDGHIRAQNRGAYLTRENCHPQFKPLFRWIGERRAALEELLTPDLILFGEWCYAVHSVRYTRLPDWFLAFDIYDRGEGQFWSAARRDGVLKRGLVHRVPELARGPFDVAALTNMLGASHLTNGPMEGLYVRRDSGPFLVARAKLVRAEFLQNIDAHWSGRRLETNELLPSSR